MNNEQSSCFLPLWQKTSWKLGQVYICFLSAFWPSHINDQYLIIVSFQRQLPLFFSHFLHLLGRDSNSKNYSNLSLNSRSWNKNFENGVFRGLLLSVSGLPEEQGLCVQASCLAWKRCFSKSGKPCYPWQVILFPLGAGWVLGPELR